MDIDAIRKGKGKHNNKGKGKSKESTKEKATEDTTATGTTIPKEKGNMEEKDTTITIRLGMATLLEKAAKVSKEKTKDTIKEKERTKEKQVTDTCYRCGRAGHYAKDCRVAIHNIGQGEHNDNARHNSTMVHRLL